MKQSPNSHSDQTISEIIAAAGKPGIWERVKTGFKCGKYVFGILGENKQQDKIRKLAVLRNENLEQTAQNVVKSGFQLIPTNLDRLDFAGQADIVTEVERTSADTFKITTSDGMVFHDWESSTKHKMMYWLMRDKAKGFYKSETLFAASAVNRSFIHGTDRFPGDVYIPSDGGTIIEAGAYVGYKAISFARQVGPTGKVIVIEASPNNYELLKKNILENELDGIATPINCAVWKKDEEIPLMSRTRMKHTIVDTDELPFEARWQYSAKCLDTIIDESGLERVDFLNLQLNGAEIEAIEGLQKKLHKVKYINIVSRHHRDGKLVVDEVREMLEDRGCKIVVDARTDRLYNLTAEVNS